MKSITFYLALCLPFLAQAQYSASLQTQKVECQNKLQELQSELSSLKAKKQKALQEMRDGLFCSECGRAKSEFDPSTESFETHIAKGADWGRHAVPATPKQLAEKEKEFNDKIASKQSSVESQSNQCNDLHNKYLEALADEDRKRREEAERLAAEAEAERQRQEEEAEAERKRKEQEAQEYLRRLEAERQAAEEQRRQELIEQSNSLVQNMTERVRQAGDMIDNLVNDAANTLDQLDDLPDGAYESRDYTSSDDFADDLFGNNQPSSQPRLDASDVRRKGQELLEAFNRSTDRLSGYVPDNILGKAKEYAGKAIEGAVADYIKEKVIPDRYVAPVVWFEHALEGAQSVHAMGNELLDILDKTLDGRLPPDQAFEECKKAIIHNLPYGVGTFFRFAY